MRFGQCLPKKQVVKDKMWKSYKLHLRQMLHLQTLAFVATEMPNGKIRIFASSSCCVGTNAHYFWSARCQTLVGGLVVCLCLCADDRLLLSLRSLGCGRLHASLCFCCWRKEMTRRDCLPACLQGLGDLKTPITGPIFQTCDFHPGLQCSSFV